LPAPIASAEQRKLRACRGASSFRIAADGGDGERNMIATSSHQQLDPANQAPFLHLLALN
jgi:hypothetical protein